MATFAVSHFSLETNEIQMTQVTATTRLEAIRLGVEQMLNETISSFENATDVERVRKLAHSVSECADAIEIV